MNHVSTMGRSIVRSNTGLNASGSVVAATYPEILCFSLISPGSCGNPRYPGIPFLCLWTPAVAATPIPGTLRRKRKSRVRAKNCWSSKKQNWIPATAPIWSLEAYEKIRPKDRTNPILPQVFPNRNFWFPFSLLSLTIVKTCGNMEIATIFGSDFFLSFQRSKP